MSDSLLLEFFDEDMNLLQLPNLATNKFTYPYTENNPSILYLYINSNYSEQYLIIINAEKIHFSIQANEDVSLIFDGSILNTIYQDYLESRRMIKAREDSLFKVLTNKEIKLTKLEKETIYEDYNKERIHSDSALLYFEDISIQTNSDNFISLVILSQAILYHQRSGMNEFRLLFDELDDDKLVGYASYHKLNSILSLKPYAVGDSLLNIEQVKDFQGQSIELDPLTNKQGLIFMYFWKKSCRFSEKLRLKLNEEIENNIIQKDRIVSVNWDKDLAQADIEEIVGEALFNCYFYDSGKDTELLDKFWVNFTPFGVIFNNGKIIRIGCHFEDYQELIK